MRFGACVYRARTLRDMPCGLLNLAILHRFVFESIAVLFNSSGL
jgi:hypothetical protein